MKFPFTLLLSLLPVLSFPQEPDWVLNGYIKDLYMYYRPEKEPATNIDGIYSNTVHNRLNFNWYVNDKITFSTGMRNRLIMGTLVSDFPNYRSAVDVDNGYLDLSWVSADDKKWFLHSIIDRAYIDFTEGSWQFRLGRQRINWGISMVWNPNDVFNSFSYFDFDYEERPGADAIKIQHYTGATSSIELAFKMGDKTEKMALAAMYRFSRWDYDFQFISGWVGDDYIIGGGWSGDIKGGGFRGEVTKFIPRNNVTNPVEATVATVSFDYTFKNSLYTNVEGLYNSHGTTGKILNKNFLFDPKLSAKQLSFAKYSLFGQVTYPFTPLFNGGISAILNPSDQSFYIGPNFAFSLSNNLELMLAGQLFFGDKDSEFGDVGQLAFGRVRWSF